VLGDVVAGEMKLNNRGRVVKEWWFNIKSRYKEVELDAMAILPNHFHGIIYITKNVGAIHITV